METVLIENQLASENPQIHFDSLFALVFLWSLYSKLFIARVLCSHDTYLRLQAKTWKSIFFNL